MKIKLGENTKLLLQIFLGPIILAIIGYGINSKLEQQKQVLQRIQITTDIVKNAYDGNEAKAFTLVSLVPMLVDDTTLSNLIRNRVFDYYRKRFVEAVKNFESDAATSIQSAAATSLSPKDSAKFFKSLPKDTNVGKLQKAKQYEQQGFQYLFKKDFDNAKQAFQKSDSVFPSYHSAYEISKLISKKEKDLNNPVKQEQAQVELLDSIKTKYILPKHSNNMFEQRQQ